MPGALVGGGVVDRAQLPVAAAPVDAVPVDSLVHLAPELGGVFEREWRRRYVDALQHSSRPAFPSSNAR